MSSVGYFEAWRLWFDGSSTLRDAELWGLPVLWWGRIGKLAAFLAGLTLIMDIVGPERLRQFSERYVRRNRSRLGIAWPAVVGAAAGALLIWAVFFPGRVTFPGGWIEVSSTGFTAVTAGIALVGSLALLVPVALQGIRRVLIHVFERDALARTVQVVALFLFIVGFHFDLLAS
ncbi:hypothetical protein [Saccharothrix variisporea]|uniref:Uncharacterized protein n=1 Tax=Saccharothrix variisporea TaxID=543527 RepID=A0A495XP22_9PSEU|nr:hypothetical protein [Saccharothrix variisporea]RKT74636.1 hypothetical protein DFJ66_8003 [Saccharothrix variisporea]